jgi:hypothetical protein
MKRPVAVAVAIPFPISFSDRSADAWEFLSGPVLLLGILATIVAFLVAVT